MVFFLRIQSIIDNQSKPMEEPISDVVPGHPVPEAHDQHIDNIGNIWVVIRLLNTVRINTITRRIKTKSRNQKDKLISNDSRIPLSHVI